MFRTGNMEIKDMNGNVLVLDGVEIRECVEVGIGHPTINFSVVAHELSHMLFGLPDMYFTFFSPTAAGQYSLMDETYSKTHIDTFNKLKLGWAHPRLIFASGRYTIPDIETRHRIIVLVDPTHNMKEYFLITNRWRGSSYDANIFDQGLAIWHIMEEASVYDAAPPPPTVDMSKWTSLGSGPGAWGRKAVRMIRPVLTPPFLDSQALWDQNDGNLVSYEPDLSKPALRWGDGTASGFVLSNLSLPASEMEVTISVP